MKLNKQAKKQMIGTEMASDMTPHDIQIVTFFLQEQEFALDVMSVREIISMTEITKPANTPDDMEGIINLRGAVIPVMSLRKRLNLTQTSEEANCIAIMDHAGELTGFAIDEISDVMRIRPNEILPPPSGVEQPWVAGILNIDQRLIMVMDVGHLLQR